MLRSSLKGLSFQDLIAKDVPFPPCVNERATFMANFDFVQRKRHPYVETSPRTHDHFRPTPLRHPPYGAAALPFRWMMRSEVFGDPENGVAGFVDRFPLDEVSADLEPSLSFKTNWLQDHRNHRALLDCFWRHVRPRQSLVFFYAKQVPFVEDTGRRVLIGVGRVKTIGELTEYRYDGPPGDRLRSLLWERMVVHSIRPEFEDGFLLPYHDAMAKSDDGRAFDPAETVAFAPEDRFVEFSFATEHVGDDAAISALLSLRGSLHRCSELFGYAADACERWIDRELGRLWKRNVARFPGSARYSLRWALAWGTSSLKLFWMRQVRTRVPGRRGSRPSTIPMRCCHLNWLDTSTTLSPKPGTVWAAVAGPS